MPTVYTRTNHNLTFQFGLIPTHSGRKISTLHNTAGANPRIQLNATASGEHYRGGGVGVREPRSTCLDQRWDRMQVFMLGLKNAE